MSKYLEGKINVGNVATFYKFAKVFILPSLVKISICYLELCFTMLVETQSFLELDFHSVQEIFSSSDLHLTTELEVFNAVQAWINYNTEERSEYERCLVKKVRLHLLSDKALEYVKSTLFGKFENSSEFITDFLKPNEYLLQKAPPVSLTNRYCTHNMFNILICYGSNFNPDVTIHYTDIYQFDGKNLNSTKLIATMPENRFYGNAAYSNGDVYFFWGTNEKDRSICSSEKYSISTRTSEHLTDVTDSRIMHCVCTFMNDIYSIGGVYAYEDHVTNYCSKFNPKEHKCREIAKMNVARAYLACSVFNGHIVVTGGINSNCIDLRSVEVYDHLTDAWSYMPDMCHVRSQHGSAAIRNKLFAVGGSYQSSGEVYDATSRCFTVLKNDCGDIGYDYMCNTFSIGNKIIVCAHGRNLCYDLNEEKWVEESFEVTKNFCSFCCVKVPFV